jgi:hypothetical protein
VPQPLARVGAFLRPDAEQIGARPLHPARGRVDVGDPGIARVLAWKSRAEPQEPRRKSEREVQRVTGAAPRLVAAPQRDEASLARARPAAHFGQLGRLDGGAKSGHRAGERLDLDGKLFQLHDQPMSAAAWRYQPTR